MLRGQERAVALQSPTQLHLEMPRLNHIETGMLTTGERARFIDAARNAYSRKAGQFMLMACSPARGTASSSASNGCTSTSSAAPSSGEGVGKGQKQLGRELSVTRPVRELLAGIGGNSSACVFPGRGA